MAAQPSVTVGGVTYRVTPGELARAASETSATASKIEHQLDQVQTFVRGLESAWQGIAQQQFQNLMREYDVLTKLLNEALMGISKGLHGTYINYTDSEQQNINNNRAISDELPAPPTTNFH